MGLRVLTPSGWIVAAVAAALGLLLLVSALDRLWARWPWSEARRLERAEARADQLQADAAVVEALTTAEREATEVIADVRTVTARSETLARSAPDAQTPLADDRAERLRDADRRLCQRAPVACQPLG